MKGVLSRDDFPAMLNELGLLGIAVEVGTNRGDYAEHFRNAWRGKLLYCVDPWEHGSYGGESREDRIVARNATTWRLANALKSGSSVILPFASVEASAAFSAEADRYAFDFVYIDGDHSYEGVKADLSAWWPLVKQGGIMAGHDWVPDGWRHYGDGPGPARAQAGEDLQRPGWPCFVQRAVMEFFGNEHNAREVKLTSPDYDGGWQSWWVVK